LKEQTNAKEPFHRGADYRDDQGQEAGMPTAEVCRRHGLSPATFYKFKYGGMEVSDAAKLKALEDENAKLKRLLSGTMLDNVVLKDLLGRN
jgi:putative transposase